MDERFIRSIFIDWTTIEAGSYLREIEALKGLKTLEFNSNVTFFVGENGSGKSTILEAMAIACGFNPEGGTKNYSFSTYDSHSELCDAMRIVWGSRKARWGYFLRAESFYNVATMEERYADAKIYIDQALKNRDSTADNSTVIEHAGDIYYMNGMADESVDFWKKAYTGENQTEVLAWKIKNRQYITEEELKKRNAPKQKPAATQKSVRKGKKK